MSDNRKRSSGLSTAVKVGVGVAAAAAAVGAGVALARYLTEEEEVPQQVSEHGALEELERAGRIIEHEKRPLKERNLFIRNIARLMLTEGLCKDALFRKMYQDVLWTRRDGPNEFDLNIILRLPFKELEVSSKDAPPGHVVIGNFRAALKSLEAANDPHWDTFKVMEGWVNAEGKLDCDKVSCWLEELCDKHLGQNHEKLLQEMGLTRLHLRKLSLQLNEVNIQLVPALEMQPPLQPPQPFRRLPNPPLPWYAVAGRDNVWRLSFCWHEQRMIHGQQTLKPAIKIIKKLRDKNLKGLTNYHIKTTALWEVGEGAVSPRLDQAFLHLLRRLQSRLQKDELSSFWDCRYSLLQNIDERENTANRLKRIIAAFERDWTTNPAAIGQTIEGVVDLKDEV